MSKELDQSAVLSLVRALAGPSFILAGWEIMPLSFGWGIGIAYLGFALLLFECVREPWLLQKPYQVQILCIGIVLLLVDLFTMNIVLIPTPICLNTMTSNLDYAPPDVGPGGIIWNPSFTELDIIFTNPTDTTYTNLNVLVRPDHPVARVAQISNLSDVSFQDAYATLLRGKVEHLRTQIRNFQFIATNAGYKVHCGSIPPHSSLEIVMAVVDIKKPEGKLPPDNPERYGVRLDYTEKDGSVFTSWYSSGTLPYLPANPTNVTVLGSYTGNNRMEKLNQELVIGQLKCQNE